MSIIPPHNDTHGDELANPLSLPEQLDETLEFPRLWGAMKFFVKAHFTSVRKEARS
jgi:hypothetical protein